MERREFIKVMSAGICIALSPALVNGFATTATAEDLKQLDLTETDIRLKLISYAMLAPNPHNIQPWLINLTGKDQFDLYVDQTRLLPETDPPSRQIHIGHGTFLEYLKIAASEMGYRVEFDYFPQGIYTALEDKPVATIRLISDPSVKRDPLFPWLQLRQSNKRVYESKLIPRKELEQLQRLSQAAGFVTMYSDAPHFKKVLGPMLGKAMDIETSGLNRNKETVDMFRFSESDAIKKRDGFTVANNGMTGIARFFVETFFLGTRKEAYAIDSSFAKEAIKMTYKQAESSAAYGWIISENNTRLDQVKSGELYARINLLTTKLGIGQHPMSQILEEYDDMKNLQKEFLALLKVPSGRTVQMLFRLGYANPVPHTKRRFVKETIS